MLTRFRNSADMEALPETALFNVLVDIVQEFDRDADTSFDTTLRNVAMACADWQECFSDGRGLILLALLSRRCGKIAVEQALLQERHDTDHFLFWKTVQSVYRFSRSNPDFCSVLSDIQTENTLRSPRNKHHICFYPDYSKGNAYQELIYKDITEFGGMVHGTSIEKSFLETAFLEGHENILHVHWINRLFVQKNSNRDLVAYRCKCFLNGLLRAKSRGFSVYWTIHNRIGHEAPYLELELDLRKKLYEISDRVFIHHPLVVDLIDWLPDRKKLFLCEHGHYNFKPSMQTSQHDARSALGFNDNDIIVTYVGQIRGYKDLGKFLPIFFSRLDENPSMKVVLAGRINSEETKNWLVEHPHPRFIVHNAFLSSDELNLYMRATDFGFLSYSAILTSGTLFHWLSCGRPVMAPAIGTIPAYLMDGWNGVTYLDSESFKRRLDFCLSLPKEELLRMGDNALATASQLGWNMWNA